MSWYPTQDSPTANGLDFDGATSVAGAPVRLGLIPIPDNFIGIVEAEIVARVINTSPVSETPYLLTIRTFITKGADGTSCTVLGAPSAAVSGTSYIMSANYLLGATLLPGAQDASVMEVIVHGRADATVYFDGHGSARGRVQSGDG